MALASSLHTMSTGSNSASSTSYLLPKNDLILADSQVIDIILHGQNIEQKIQAVNRWCKNPRRNRLSTILDVSQRYDVLLSLTAILKQTNNAEFQFNCLTLLSELQSTIQNYDQRLYLPAIIHCFSSAASEVQSLTCQLLIKQSLLTQDITTFLFLFTEEGLKSGNNRTRLQSIRSLTEFISEKHRYENLSPILEILLVYLHELPASHSNSRILLNNSIEHMKRILGAELYNNHLENYSPSIRRVFKENENRIPTVDTDLEDEEQTPRASVQVSHLRDNSENSRFIQAGNNGMRSNQDLYPEDLQQIYPVRKLSLPPTPSATNESNDFYSIIEIMRSKWLSSDESMRLDYLDRFKQSCDKYLQFIRNQHLSFGHESQFHQTLHSFLTSILDVLNYMTSSNLDLSLRIKLVLATCLGWLIKHAQVIYCKKNYRTICTVFKNILFHGASNNRQLAKLSVSLILLLENFVHPQLILNELVDDSFQYSSYRIQLEMLAIVTASLLKYRQHQYENLPTISKQFLPMLTSNRRELRHGALECFTVICSHFSNYRPIDSSTMETNASIRLLFSMIENVSYDASTALRFRLQRNLLPILTDEGNITPGLVCDANNSNEADVKFILSGINPTSNSSTDSSSNVKPNSTNNKIINLPMPLASSNKNNSTETVIRTRDMAPLKASEADLEVYRPVNSNRHSHQTSHFNKRMVLPNKRQTPAASHVPSGPAALDLAISVNNSYRPLTLTEKVFHNEWQSKAAISTQNPKDLIANKQKTDNLNGPLPFRPVIPRRSSAGRFPVVQQSQTSLADQTKHIVPLKRHFDSELDHDDGIDSAIESRSISINPSESSPLENGSNSIKKAGRSVHSSSTRRKAERLFSTGSDFESSSARTLTPENSNESGVYSHSGRDVDSDSSRAERSNQPVGKDQLFSTKPRLARSGSKSKLDRSQLPPTDPSSSSRTVEDPNTGRTNMHKAHVEVIGKNFIEDKAPPKHAFNDSNETPKSRTKIGKGAMPAVPLHSTTTHTNPPFDSEITNDDGQDMGVFGKAVHLPLRSRPDGETLQSNYSTPMNNKTNQRSDSVDMVSDGFDSDSKENENLTEVGQTLSASFRLRVQQKTQEKIEQKERRRQDREIRRRQLQMNSSPTNNTSDPAYDTDVPASSTSTSRYSSQPDLSSLGNELPPTARRPIESILPNVSSPARTRGFKNAMARSQTFNNRRDLSNTEQRIAFNRPLSEDRVTDQLKNPEGVYREAMDSIANDDWERKCSGLGLLQRLIAQYPDLITQNLHQVVLVLIQEVKNLRSQVARFALSTFCDMFIHLKRNMDIELDLTVKAVMQKSAESNDFLRSDAEKCLQSMIDNVTLQKALQALIAGGASHRNPAIRKTSAKYIYLVCEKLGPAKILSGTRDITERVLQIAANFASDGPPEIRWYGKKIYHMLMPFDELDASMKHFLNPTAYTNMCEILDNIRAKGGVGETPSESARNNGRRALSSDKVGSNGNSANQFASMRKINSADQTEQVRALIKQMRSSDFRERLNGIEEFQKLCELETDTAIQSLVSIFDGFNDCLADTNSKVLQKALNTMHQLVPILGDSLSNVINSTLPIVTQSIASKNREISQLASDIIDAAIEYIDGGYLLQPLCVLSQNSNLRIRPEVILKLATLVPRVCQRKPKQVEIHLLPTYWKLLGLLRGQSTTAISPSAGTSNSLNSSIHILTTALYAEYGSVLLDKASASSMVTPKNLQTLRELCANIDAV